IVGQFGHRLSLATEGPSQKRAPTNAQHFVQESRERRGGGGRRRGRHIHSGCGRQGCKRSRWTWRRQRDRRNLASELERRLVCRPARRAWMAGSGRGQAFLAWLRRGVLRETGVGAIPVRRAFEARVTQTTRM